MWEKNTGKHQTDLLKFVKETWSVLHIWVVWFWFYASFHLPAKMRIKCFKQTECAQCGQNKTVHKPRSVLYLHVFTWTGLFFTRTQKIIKTHSDLSAGNVEKVHGALQFVTDIITRSSAIIAKMLTSASRGGKVGRLRGQRSQLSSLPGCLFLSSPPL